MYPWMKKLPKTAQVALEFRDRYLAEQFLEKCTRHHHSVGVVLADSRTVVVSGDQVQVLGDIIDNYIRYVKFRPVRSASDRTREENAEGRRKMIECRDLATVMSAHNKMAENLKRMVAEKRKR